MSTDIFKIILLVILIVCAIAVFFLKDLLTSIVVFMSYSSVMAVLWIVLESPDLAITEAAVGAGVTSVLFFLTLKRIHQVNASLNNLKGEKLDEKEK